MELLSNVKKMGAVGLAALILLPSFTPEDVVVFWIASVIGWPLYLAIVAVILFAVYFLVE